MCRRMPQNPLPLLYIPGQSWTTKMRGNDRCAAGNPTRISIVPVRLAGANGRLNRYLPTERQRAALESWRLATDDLEMQNQLDQPQTGILLSGGIDSAVLLDQLLGRGWQVVPFYVRTGCVWESTELDATRR